jgi:hypothetical protein
MRVVSVSTVEKRLAALEAVVASIGHNGCPPLDDGPPLHAELDPATDRLLSTAAIAARYGVSTRTIDRWRGDPELGFPPTENVNGRNYNWLSKLVRWDRQRVAAVRKTNCP